MAKLRLKHSYHFNLLVIGLIAIGLILYAIFRIFLSHAATNNADFNSSGKVDIIDLSILANHFGTTSGATLATGDANGDGAVNVTDLSILASQWGTNTGSGSSCTSFFSGTTTATNFPCPATTGVPTGTTLKIAAHSATACTNCPAGVVWDSNHGYTIPACVGAWGSRVVVDGWQFDEGISMRASNGNKLGGGLNEVSTKALACAVFTRDRIAPAGNAGHLNNGLFGIALGSPGQGGGDVTCPSYPCGPVFLADTEINMPFSVNGYDYSIGGTNWAIWRVYSHGTFQSGSCQGWCDAHDSFFNSDHDGGSAHGDGFISNGNSSGRTSGMRPIYLDHNTLLCTESNPADETSGGGCSGDLGLFSDVTLAGYISGITVKNNLFLPTSAASPTSAHVCAYTGQDEPLKAGTGYNITFSGNVWVKNSPQLACHNAPIDSWNTSTANGANDRWCNNKYDDGTYVDASAEPSPLGSGLVCP